MFAAFRDQATSSVPETEGADEHLSLPSFPCRSLHLRSGMARLTSLILVAACAWNATKGSVGIWSDMLRISNISSGQIGWFTKFCTLQIFPVLPRLVHGPEIDQSLVHWRSYDPSEIRCSKTCFRLLCCSSTLQMEDLNTTVFTLTLRGTPDHTGPRVLPRVMGVCAQYTGKTSRVDQQLLTCIASHQTTTSLHHPVTQALCWAAASPRDMACSRLWPTDYMVVGIWATS